MGNPTGKEIRNIAAGLWVVDAPFSLIGIQLGGRMTIVNIGGDQLALISPTKADDGLFHEIKKLGKVAVLIAPNNMHHLYIGDYKAAFPDAKIFASPGLSAKRKDLKIDKVLGEAPEPELADTMDSILTKGAPQFDEVVFFHKAAKTLILTDYAFNIGKDASFFTKVYMSMMGATGRVCVPRLLKMLTKDKAAAKVSRDEILRRWDFSRIIVCHGKIAEADQIDEFRQAVQWLG